MLAGPAYMQSCFTAVENGMEKQVTSNPQSTSDLFIIPQHTLP
jgi:hypothetical protein